MMRDLRKSPTPTKLLLFISQVLVCYLLTFDCSAADSPPPGVLHRRDERPLPKYKYSYMVRGLEGGQHGHQVYRDGAYTQGKYFVRLNGGSGQNVEYYTDHFGYHPKVIYMNHMATGSSGARIAFGRAAAQFEISSTTTETPEKPAENQTTEAPANETNTSTPYPTETTLQQSTPNFNTVESEQYGSRLNTAAVADNEKFNSDTVANTSPYPTEDNVSDNIYNSHSIGSIGPILLTHPSDEAYLQPEINEITNGFVGKIVSMLPSIIASNTKLLKPIIVTDNTATNKRDINTVAENSTEIKSDQVVDSAQPEEYREIPDEQIIAALDNETLSESEEEVKTEPPKYTEVEIKKPQVDVQIEPQMLEEQAVITTTVDIAKSLPIALNFAPETDNHINDIGQPLALQSLNLVPTQQQVLIPPQNVLLPPHNEQDHPVMELQLPHAIHQPFMLPSSEFHYIPIPVLQHQPNTIPLNYINDTRSLLEIENTNIRHQVPEQAPQEHQRPDYSFVKSVEDYSNVPYKPLDLPRKPFNQHFRQVPYAVNIPATHLLPYVKQNFLQPHSHPQYKQPLPTASSKSHTIAYMKNYPKEKRTPLQKAPFKPSHPVWDSVYPPSHMYYVPLYVVDKVPGERNPKDSFSRRHNHLRRLYVEYGGFKPPLVPSTLIEPEETAQEKRDVPKEGGGAES